MIILNLHRAKCKDIPKKKVEKIDAPSSQLKMVLSSLCGPHVPDNES